MKTPNYQIAFYRKQKGLTRSDLATLLGIDEKLYFKYETGEIAPPAELLCRIADICSTSVNSLLGISRPKTEPIIKISRAMMDNGENKD